MNRLTRDQKTKVTQFRGITGASEKGAMDCLKAGSWNLEASIDFYYASGMANSAVSMDGKALETLFARYKEPDEDIILAEGVGKFCDDLGVDPADIVMLVISYHMGAEYMCEFKKSEFINGMSKMGCDSLDKLTKKLPELRAELQNEERFRDIYNYAYMFSREKGQKCLQLDTAIGMWQLLYADERRWAFIDDWCEFLQKHHNRAIVKDTWTQLFDFSRQVKADFSNYDESAAWPYLMDEFVEHMKEQKQ